MTHQWANGHSVLLLLESYCLFIGLLLHQILSAKLSGSRSCRRRHVS
jgi:hypothetical protein